MSGQKKDRRGARLRRRAERAAQLKALPVWLEECAIRAYELAAQMYLVGYFLGRVAVVTREIRQGVYSHKVTP